MTRALTSGVYRQYCDVVGPKGSARVERMRDWEGQQRYTVRHSPADQTLPQRVLVATCWRDGVPAERAKVDRPYRIHLDGGWERAVSIAEHLTQGRAYALAFARAET